MGNRIFFDPYRGCYVCTRLVLDEGHPRVLNRLHFESFSGDPIGSIPLDPALSLADLSIEDLLRLVGTLGRP